VSRVNKKRLRGAGSAGGFFAALVFCMAIVCAPAADNAAVATAAPSAPVSAPARDSRWAAPLDASLNLYRVTPALYRCKQFTKEQVPALQKLGIRTVVDLRHTHTDDDLLRDSGIKAVSVPMNTWGINDERIIAALAAIRRAGADGPVAVHCEHGADRTGAVCAMYRVVYQGWTPGAAIDELRHGGYGFHWIWLNIPRYIQKADAQKIAAAVEARLAAPPLNK